MIENSVELELEAIRQHLVALSQQARSGPEEPGLEEVLGRLAAALDGLQQLAEDLRVQNEDLLTTRQTVEEERQRYLALFEFAPDGFLVTDLDGVIREVNRAAAALFQVRQEFLPGKPLVTFVTPEDRTAFRGRLAQLPIEREVHGWDVALQPRTGERFHVSMNVAALSAAGPAPASLHWLIRDITERKRMEARFHATVESAPTAMVMVDSGGSIGLINAEAERLFGYARQELLGQHVELLVPERFRGEHPRLRSQFFGAPEARRMGAGRDLFGLRKDGSEFPVEIGLSPIETEEGLFVLSTIVDITERKRMEDALRRQHQWDAALVNIGQAATALLPFEEILTRGLEAILQASGATLGLVRRVDPETRDLVTVAHRGVAQEYLALAERIPWGKEPVGAVAASGQPRLIGRPQEFPGFSHLSLLDGWAESLACLPLLAGGRVLGTLVLGHPQAEFFSPADLQAFLPAASMLAGAIRAEQLRAAILKEAEERALLFRELDHRVRNNLAALISLLHLGAEGAEGTTADRLREMADRVARLAEVHNLLTGRERQPIEIRDLARVIAKDVLTVLRADVQIRWTVTGEPVRVPPSRVTAIALILNELLTNCVKHAFPGRGAGSVHIQVGREGDHAVLEVRDDGVGLDRARQRAGLGLGIVETLVTHNLGGTLRVAHEGGTLVTVRFPQVEEVPEGGAG